MGLRGQNFESFAAEHSSHVVRKAFLFVIYFSNPVSLAVIGDFPRIPGRHVGAAGAIIIGIRYGNVILVHAGKLPPVLPGIVPGPIIRQVANAICRQSLSII